MYNIGIVIIKLCLFIEVEMEVKKTNHYELEEVSIDSLILDINNPRMFRLLAKDEQNIKESDIIDYLIQYEKLTELVDKIKTHGWRPTDDPWVIKNEKGYLVKEGNRRVASLKKINDELTFTTITVKVYTNINVLLELMEEIHVMGPEKWKPIGQGFLHMEQNKKTLLAHLVRFCKEHKISSLFEIPEAFTTVTESLAKRNSYSILRCYLDDDKFEYSEIGLDKMKYIVQEIIIAYSQERVNTRKREQIPAVLQEIRKKFENYDKLEDKNENSTNFTSNGIPDNKFNPQPASDPDSSRPRASSVLSINDRKAFNFEIKEIIKTYGKKIEKENSYKILRELSKINVDSFPIATSNLLRCFVDALAFEGSGKDKGSNFVTPYYESLKNNDNFKSHKKRLENFLKEYSLISSRVHGQVPTQSNYCYNFLQSYSILFRTILKFR